MVQDIADMDGIIHQFLDFVRGIEGEPTRLTDLNELVISIAERHIRAGHNLTLNLAPTHMIQLRPLAMQHLLGNLINNAFSYGTGEVMISSRITSASILLARNTVLYAKSVPVRFDLGGPRLL